jgi:hypothetical protein
MLVRPDFLTRLVVDAKRRHRHAPASVEGEWQVRMGVAHGNVSFAKHVARIS